jgi:hypothetical protein
MAYSKEIRRKALRHYEDGMTFVQIQKRTGVNEKTIRRWYRESHADGPKQNVRKRPGHKFPTFTPLQLSWLFPASMIPRLSFVLDLCKRQKNPRLHRFVAEMLVIKNLSPDLPESWRAGMAGFPILAEDIHAPAFSRLAEVMDAHRPPFDRKTRRAYHRTVASVLREVLAQSTQWALPSGHFLVAAGKPGPTKNFDSWEEMEAYVPTDEEVAEDHSRIEESLVKGKTMMDKDDRAVSVLRDTPWGYVLEIVSRLPDLDKKKKGKVFKQAEPLSFVLFNWCAQDSWPQRS